MLSRKCFSCIVPTGVGMHLPQKGAMAGIAKIDGINGARERKVDIRFNNDDNIGVCKIAQKGSPLGPERRPRIA
jgi:hypothetical protein